VLHNEDTIILSSVANTWNETRKFHPTKILRRLQHKSDLRLEHRRNYIVADLRPSLSQ